MTLTVDADFACISSQVLLALGRPLRAVNVSLRRKPRMPDCQGSFLSLPSRLPTLSSSPSSSSFHFPRLLSRPAFAFGEHHVNLSDDSLAVGVIAEGRHS